MLGGPTFSASFTIIRLSYAEIQDFCTVFTLAEVIYTTSSHSETRAQQLGLWPQYD